jgi:uncharacterized membrane protein
MFDSDVFGDFFKTTKVTLNDTFTLLCLLLKMTGVVYDPGFNPFAEALKLTCPCCGAVICPE